MKSAQREIALWFKPEELVEWAPVSVYVVLCVLCCCCVWFLFLSVVVLSPCCCRRLLSDVGPFV